MLGTCSCLLSRRLGFTSTTSGANVSDLASLTSLMALVCMDASALLLNNERTLLMHETTTLVFASKLQTGELDSNENVG